MKYIFAIMLLAAMAIPATAAFKGPGTAEVSTVTAALGASDETRCSLEGVIVEKVNNEDDDYVFRDDTGTIIVEIDEEVFAGRTVTPQTRVRLTGDVEKKLLRDNKVEVEYLEIIQ